MPLHLLLVVVRWTISFCFACFSRLSFHILTPHTRTQVAYQASKTIMPPSSSSSSSVIPALLRPSLHCLLLLCLLLPLLALAQGQQGFAPQGTATRDVSQNSGALHCKGREGKKEEDSQRNCAVTTRAQALIYLPPPLPPSLPPSFPPSLLLLSKETPSVRPLPLLHVHQQERDRACASHSPLPLSLPPSLPPSIGNTIGQASAPPTCPSGKTCGQYGEGYMCCYDNSEEWCCSPGEEERGEGGGEEGLKGRAGQRGGGRGKGSVLLFILPLLLPSFLTQA